jgi:hypothetical protein
MALPKGIGDVASDEALHVERVARFVSSAALPCLVSLSRALRQLRIVEAGHLLRRFLRALRARARAIGVRSVRRFIHPVIDAAEDVAAPISHVIG